MAQEEQRSYQDEYLEIVRDLDGDVDGRAAADAYLRHTSIYVEGRGLRYATNAIVYDEREFKILNNAAHVMGSIMEKVMAKYQRDRNFRALFELPPAVEELTLVPSGCHAAVPLSRIDMFFDRATGDFRIVDIVTGAIDGIAMNNQANRAVRNTNAYRRFAEKHPNVASLDAAESCALSILHTYGKWANASEGRNHPTRPSLAVVDVAGSPRTAATRTVIERLRDMGCLARATDFSKLRIVNVAGIQQLVDDEGPVTCVWLRATIDEAVAHMDKGMRVLADATRHGLVCTVGGYRSWPCCTRAFLSVLHSKECRSLLTYSESAFVRAHVPQMHMITPAADISRFYNQEKWVLKTADGHLPGSVVVGADVPRAAWRQMLVKGIKRRDAVQAYIDRSPVTVVTADEDGSSVEDEMNLVTGLYVFESKLCGIRTTSGKAPNNVGWDERLEMGCLVVRDEE